MDEHRLSIQYLRPLTGTRAPMEHRLHDGLPAAALLVVLALLLPSSECKLPAKRHIPSNRPLVSDRLSSEYEELMRTKREILNHTITDRHIFFVDLRNKSQANPRPSLGKDVTA